MVKFSATKEETKTIMEIAKRASEKAKELGVNYSILDASMDVKAVHLNNCKLKLNELLDSVDHDFCHDVFGIRRYIDRSTGQLTNHFLPRYSL